MGTVTLYKEMQDCNPKESESLVASFDPDTWARYLLRELYDLGYNIAAQALEKEACVSVDSKAMQQIRSYLQNFEWDQALRSLNNLKMRGPTALQEAKRAVAIGKYFFFLFSRKSLEEAIFALHNDLVPLYQTSSDRDKFQNLAMLLLCTDYEQAAKMNWLDHTEFKKLGKNQPHQILRKLEKLVESRETIAEGSLRKYAIQTVKRVDVPAKRNCLQYECVQVIMEHIDEVWNIVFSNTAQFLATSSKDGTIVVWDMTSLENEAYRTDGLKIIQRMRDSSGATEHLAWSPHDTFLVSCGSSNSAIYVWNVKTGIADYIFKHPKMSASSAVWLSDEEAFLTGSAEKSLVLWKLSEGDFRRWSEHVILDMQVHRAEEGFRLYTLTGNTACSKDSEDPSIAHQYRIQSYDHAFFSKASSKNYTSDELVEVIILESKEPIASFNLSTDGQYLLVNYIMRQTLEVIRIKDRMHLGPGFDGFKESRYVLLSCFASIEGEEFDSLVVSGSEDGSILCWDRASAERLCTLKGHTQTVNKVVSHPRWKNILASASDDETVRLWRLHNK
ncbi:hypothetical protein ABG067_003233 [Albugo candida]